MDRAELARACVEVEKAGGSVREFLAEQGCISPWGTWYRLQKEELHRKESQITDGKGRVNMARKITLEQKKKVVQIAIEGGDPLEYLRQLGSKNPSGLWWTIKNDVKAADPELYAKIPRLDGKQQHIIPPAEREAKREEIRKEAAKRGVKFQPDEKPVEYKPEAVEPVLTIRSEELLKADEPKVDMTISHEDLEKSAAGIFQAEIPVSMLGLPKKSNEPVFMGFMITSIRGGFGEWRREGESLDFKGTDGEEICMRPDAWLKFAEEMQRAMGVLMGVKIDKNEDKTA